MAKKKLEKSRTNKHTSHDDTFEPASTQGKSKFTRIVIIVFAVLMALSMTLPSLAQIFASNRTQAEEQARQEEQAKAQEEQQKDSEGSASPSSEKPDTTTVAGIAKLYENDISRHEQALEKNKDSLVDLLQLGKTYMQAGTQASGVAKNEDDAKQVATLFNQAKGYFDRYLALQDAVTVRVDRALCDLYTGNIDATISSLVDVTDAAPKDAGSEYGYAYLYLGIAYQAKGDTDAAKAAYQQAQKLDPDDEFGARSMAVARLAQLASANQPQTPDSGTSGNGGTGAGDKNSGVDSLLSDLNKKQ